MLCENYRPPRRYSVITKQRNSFVAELLRNGGNGIAAALHAGYSASCAGTVASNLLREDRILALIAAECVRHPTPATAKVTAKLTRKSRKPHLVARFKMLLNGGGIAKKLETPQRQAAILIDQGAATMRDYAAQCAAKGEIDPFGDVLSVKPADTDQETQASCQISEPMHRTKDADYREKDSPCLKVS
jgi:hypothetical protein